VLKFSCYNSHLTIVITHFISIFLPVDFTDEQAEQGTLQAGLH
jgi:hypothetical protein